MGRIPDPKPGLVFRYDFLRPHEFDEGIEHGKERPACVLMTLQDPQRFRMSVKVNQETVNDTAKLIMHRLIARRLLRDPSLVVRAQQSLAKMAVRFPDRPFVQEWEVILSRSPKEIATFLTDRGEEARRLRLSSPFVIAEGIDFTDETLRRRIWRAAKRVASSGEGVLHAPPAVVR